MVFCHTPYKVFCHTSHILWAQGYASDVYLARCNFTKEQVVLKVYRLANQCDLQVGKSVNKLEEVGV